MRKIENKDENSWIIYAKDKDTKLIQAKMIGQNIKCLRLSCCIKMV